MNGAFDADRRSFLSVVAGTGIVVTSKTPLSAIANAGLVSEAGKRALKSADPRRFWPGGARLVISVSMQFESGAQDSQADGPLPPASLDFEDSATTSWYAYGIQEGIPRLLDLWDRYQIKVTSHMIGLAVDRAPALAKEIVDRGHEAAGHGQTTVPTYLMKPDEERAAYFANIQSIENATGTRPIGFNAFGLRHTPATLGVLQELGFHYHVDSLSSNEPLLVMANERPFVIIPYTLRNNDFVRYGNPATTVRAFVQDLRDDFDALYEEASHRRRMMSVATHDRISGLPGLAYALREFLHYARSKAGVAFMRKDDIARWMLTETHRESPV